MVIVRGSKKYKWLRPYRLCFVIGIFILFCQIYLAARFLPNNKNHEQSNGHEKQLQSVYTDDADSGGNSARKSRAEGLSSDDEDAQNSLFKNKKIKNNTTLIAPHLRLEELDFVPPCEITTKEAVSAIHRAKTQKCKQLISNITCLSLANKLYPHQLSGRCPADGYSPGRELGCFKDEKDFRLLSGYFGINKKENSPSYCIKLCLQSGFPYAGVQYSNECFCGNDEPPSTSKIPDSSCNMKCPGDSHATCGGYYTINIFQTGIKKFIAQTANTNFAIGDKRVKIVFLLTFNGRAIRQVMRLIKNLYHIDHYYYIHVDVRQDYLFRELLVLEKLLKNVKLTRKRFATIWGGASLLQMLRSCMNELLQIKEWQWDFVLNLSESDFPVKNITQLTEFLSSNINRNFVKSHGREVQRFIQKQGLDKTFVECDTRMWRIGDRQLPSGIQIDGGSDWIALSRLFVNYVSNPTPDELISGLLRIFNLTLLPAESFFHTALRNSQFCNTYVDNNLHVTNWKRKLGCKCQYKHIVDWCGCSPNDFRPDDWARIQNTLPRQLYFARKFEPIINQAVILQLELWLRNFEKPTRFVENLYGYWQNFYHFQDLGVTPNDGLLTLGHSIKRRLGKVFANSSCSKSGINALLQINSYHYKDEYKYTLFYVNTSSVNLEVAVKPISYRSILQPLPLWQHLEVLLVSSEYDQKEQVSRNFVNILSPYSEPILMYQFGNYHASQSYNMTCLWINPIGHLQDVNYIFIDENLLIGHVKPNLKQPYLPGNWTVKILYKNNIVMQLQFLITPLEFFSGIPLTGSQISFLHKGSQYSRDIQGFEKFLPNDHEREILNNISVSNSKRRDIDLIQWIDSLTSKFYNLEKVCAHVSNKNGIVLCGTKIPSCLTTNWSSFAPDPKSAITTVNNSTGMFDIW